MLLHSRSGTAGWPTRRLHPSTRLRSQTAVSLWRGRTGTNQRRWRRRLIQRQHLPAPVQLEGSGFEGDVRHCTSGSCFQVLIARYLWAITRRQQPRSVDDGDGAWKGGIVVSLVKAERAEADSMESATLMAMPARGSLDPDTAGPWRRASSREAGAMVLDDHREQRRG